jgi:Ser/Thr protein kinase RdoA (MazF antagonist)
MMLDNRYDLNAILACYPAIRGGIREIVDVPAGFSGAGVWKVETTAGEFCLRCWPKEHPDAGQLLQIHTTLRGVFAAGFERVSVPMATADEKTFVKQGGFLWEVGPWLPGAAILGALAQGAASIDQALAAMQALAEFHIAMERSLAVRQPAAIAPGILRRLDQLQTLMSGGFAELRVQVSANREAWPALSERGVRLIMEAERYAAATEQMLQQAAAFAVPIQPCIRDIHREHLLFEQDRVTGIVDFGAMQADSPACDVARLLGSIAGNDPTLWTVGLAAFSLIRPLSDAERLLVRAYDETGALLSGINWLRWVFVDGRIFESRARVLARFDEIAARLHGLVGRKLVIPV